MLSLIKSPWGKDFADLVSATRTSLTICSPFVGRGPCEEVCRLLKTPSAAGTLTVDVITDLSPDNLLAGTTDADALFKLTQDLAGTTVRFVASIHAKVYVADEGAAIVTSGNLTNAGLYRNLEYGVRVTDARTVRAIRRDVLEYGNLGAAVTPDELRRFAGVAERLRAARAKADRSMRAKFREEFAREIEAATVESIRVRSAGRSANAVFADTIRYLLERGPMTTAELHDAIQAIHPDFCDDKIDRVIDGRHFGKKWKHAVRTAQQFLKRSGQVMLRGNLWHKAG